MTQVQSLDVNELLQAAVGGQQSAPLGIYLGGPVTEFLQDSPSYAAKWREDFPQLLDSFSEKAGSFTYNNPCEGLYEENLTFEQTEYNNFRYQPQFILDRCVNQMLNSEIIVMNFLNSVNYLSPGSFWELGFAFAIKNKYIILIDDPNGKAANHPIINLASHFVASNLYEAAQYCVYLEKKQAELRV